MTSRKAKRFINQADEWVVFTSERKEDNQHFKVLVSNDEAWEVLLNLAVNDYHIRETFRNIVKTADEYIKNTTRFGRIPRTLELYQRTSSRS